MTLIQEIIDGASGTDTPVSSLLRKVKVLASRTGTASSLGAWVDQELSGYNSVDDVPAYRGPHAVLVLGDFFGVMGSGIRNFQIPPSTFPADMREGLFDVRFTQSAAELEELAKQDVIQLSWPPDGVLLYNRGVELGVIQRIVRDDMLLAQVVRPVDRSVVLGVLDAVRNRILDLALELEAVAPEAGTQGATEQVKQAAQQVVNNYNFHGAGSNIAIGSSNFTQTIGLPAAGDLEGLVRYLAAIGIAPAHLVELETALAEDAEAQESGPDGPRVRKWLARATSAVGTELVATGTATLAIEALKAFFGS